MNSVTTKGVRIRWEIVHYGGSPRPRVTATLKTRAVTFRPSRPSRSPDRQRENLHVSWTN
jgi:hypothetical protein